MPRDGAGTGCYLTAIKVTELEISDCEGRKQFKISFKIRVNLEISLSLENGPESAKLVSLCKQIIVLHVL
jgi:hypothetical protein